MILSCPSCTKRFMLDGRLLGEGRKVKCGQCGHVWFAEPSMALAPPPPPRAAAVQRQAAPARAPLASVERPGASVSGRPAARNAVSPPPPPPPPPAPLNEPRATLFDDPPADDLAGFGDVGSASGDDVFDSKRFDNDADDMGLSRPFRPRPVPKGSNLPAIPGQSKARRAAMMAWAALALVVGGIGTGLYYGKDPIIQTWPAAFPLYEMVGLAELPGTGLSEPGDAKTTKVEIRDIEGINMLFVTGEIANMSDRQRDVPDIQAVALGEDGKELYAWRIVPPVRRLFPNQSTKFESRVPEREGTQAKNISFRYVAPELPSAH
ncbi:hypothetical protein CHU95_03920 [Niveispirillum lacus]|uniref:Zinc finger/thioredoxin putative domain-containing protein n=1 Tax=Niveispirillum lacus TaxID=1981099 RepID=A0A255Z647_9PROT|nr:zinc-ribbon domain-containing protein [Niveispirillum lacus]OYQ36394.1 hypothetical protein CHU95_03920 [Niveispirillum lacus]